MILSKSATYALRATLLLCEAEDDHPIPVEEIAERLEVPRNYLSKILHQLAQAGILDSTRGPRGGFRSRMPAEALRVSDVVGVFDELPDENSCLLGRDRCSDADPCRAHGRWMEVRSAIMGLLRETRLVDLSVDRAGT